MEMYENEVIDGRYYNPLYHIVSTCHKSSYVDYREVIRYNHNHKDHNYS